MDDRHRLCDYQDRTVSRKYLPAARADQHCRARINPSIPTFTELNLPEIFSKIAEKEQGLVMMAGITGSGKSTTLPRCSSRSTRRVTCIS